MSSQYEIRLIDFTIYNISDEIVESEEDEEDAEHEEFKKFKVNDTKFMIQMFGINESRETFSINVLNFKPFFYLLVNKNWTELTKIAFLNHIKEKVGKYYENGFDECKFIMKKKLYGFDSGIKHKFIYISFNNIPTFNKVKNLWYYYEKQQEIDELENHEVEINSFKSPKLNPNGYCFKHADKKINILLYESNIPPLLRFFHIQQISPSGWIGLPLDKTQKIEFGKKTTCNYELSVEFNHIIALNEKETRVPYKICSFDIEASSSHGDFPIPKKSYKKMAQNIIDYIIKNKDELKTIEKIKNLIYTGFGFGNENGIDLVYPKNKKITKIQIERIINEWINQSIDCSSNINNNILTIESMFEKIKLDTSGEEVEVEEVEEGPGEYHGINDSNEEYPLEYGEKYNVSDKQKIINVIYDEKIERETRINILNKTMTAKFPQLEGDKVTFIGSTFMNYGEPTPYLSHCAVLNTCTNIDENIKIEVCDTEADLLLAWRNIIQKEDPDIIIGYNIFGFDYPFMFCRAEECDCLEDFLKLSRNVDEICSTKIIENGKTIHKMEESSVTLASGTHDIKYIRMAGRYQIDLYNHFRRAENFSSYKLDYVAGYLIGDYIKKMDYDENDNIIKIYTTNFTGLYEGSYIHLEEIGHTTEYYNNGEKFQVLKIFSPNYFTVIGLIKIKPENEHKKLRWCLAKDDVSPKDIFRMTNGSDEDRYIIAKYCIQDCNLVQYLLNKVDLITGLIEMASICSVPISFLIFRGQGIKLTSYVAKKCRERGILLPVVSKGSMDDAFEGALVLDPKCNLYLEDPVPVGDFASLYPSVMISENLSHDSKVWTKEYDLSNNLIRENGEKNLDGSFKYDNLPNYEYVDIQFDTFTWVRKTPKSKADKVISGYKVCRFAQFPNGEKGVMPSILQELLKARKTTRKLIPLQTDEFMKNVYDQRQLAYKVTANSLYGQCGAKTSTFYEQDIAAATTSGGRKLLTYAKRIVEECYTDIVCETKQGRVKVNAEYVYGDTDSVFFTFNLKNPDTLEKITGKMALELSIEIAQEATHLVSTFLKEPHDFEYEKTFFPLALLSKKRYVGILYETDPNKGKRKEMGIVLKRRDNAPIVKDVYGGIIDILMKEQDISKAMIFLDNCLKNIITEKYPMEKLIISKSLSSSYKKPNQIAHKVLADRITSRDPGNKPSSGDRIPFIFIHCNNKKALQGEKIETPTYIIENKLKINYSHYISNQIMKPVAQIFSLVLEKIWKLQNKTIKIKKFNKDVESLKIKYKDDDKKFEEKLDKLKNDEVQILMFDKYLRESDNIKNSTQSITKFFSSKK